MNNPFYPHIFEPFTVKNMTLKNRIVMPAMGTNLAGEYGEVTERQIRYYEERARGGTGLIIVENVNVDYPQGTNGSTQPRIDHERYIPGLSRLVEAVRKYNARIGVQLNYAGASSNNERTEGRGVVSSSDVPSKIGGEVPRPLTKEEIYNIVKKFGQAAKRAVIAGFDCVEIHGGHSYLICQFLSPYTNQRNDEFGGSPENRARFCSLILQEVRKQVGPDFPVLLRINAEEFMKDGIDLEDTFKLLPHLLPYVDVLDVSAGSNFSMDKQIEPMKFEEGWKVYLSAEIRKRFDIPTITVGSIRTPEVAEKILASKKADLVAIGRGLICEPEWVNKVEQGDAKILRKCISCNVGCVVNRIYASKPIKCTLNPEVVPEREIEREIRLNRSRRNKPVNIVVIGAGPAGLEAACTAAEAGCITYLFEKENEIGGLPRLIKRFPAKRKMGYVVEYMEERVRRLKNLGLFLCHSPSPQSVELLKPDLIILATGAKPALPPIKGLRENVSLAGSAVGTVVQFLRDIQDYDQTKQKDIVVAGGGAVGLDCAEFFAEQGARVVVVEKLPYVGGDLEPITKKNILETLESKGVKIYTDTNIEEVGAREIRCTSGDKTLVFGFDRALICLGFQPEKGILQEFADYFGERRIPVLSIGDLARPRKMINAVGEGRNILHALLNIKQ